MVDFNEFISYFIHPTKRTPGLETAHEFIVPPIVGGGKISTALKLGGVAIGGTVVGADLMSLFGGTKTTTVTPTQTPTQTTYTITTSDYHPYIYAPQSQTTISSTYAPQLSYILNSPGAAIKNAMDIATSQTPEQEGSWLIPYTQTPTVSPSQEATQETGIGTDLLPIVVIGIIGLVAYGFVSNRGKKKK